MHISRLFPVLSAIGIASASAAYSQGSDPLSGFEYDGYLQFEAGSSGGTLFRSFSGLLDMSGPLGGGVGFSFFAYGMATSSANLRAVMPSLYFNLNNDSRLYVGIPRSAMALYRPESPLLRNPRWGPGLFLTYHEGPMALVQVVGSYGVGIRYDTKLGAVDVSASANYYPAYSNAELAVAAQYDTGGLIWSGGASYLQGSNFNAFVAVKGQSGAFSYGAEYDYSASPAPDLAMIYGNYAVNDRLSIGLSGAASLSAAPSYIAGVDAIYKLGSSGFVRADLTSRSTSGVQAALSVGLDF